MMTGLPGEERLKGIDALAKLDQARLSPFGRQVLTDRAALLRREVGAGILDKGKAAFRKQDWPETIDQLTRFLGMAPQPDDAVEASYYLGNALLQVRKFEDAIRHLSHFVDADKRAKNREFALVLLVQAHDALGQREKANEVAREGLNAYPNGEFRGVFFQRTQRRPEQQPAAAVPGVPPAGAAPQAAQPPATPAAAPGPTKPQASPATAPAPTR
jgi:tetratricopeptide (TPR) repeat protein